MYGHVTAAGLIGGQAEGLRNLYIVRIGGPDDLIFENVPLNYIEGMLKPNDRATLMLSGSLFEANGTPLAITITVNATTTIGIEYTDPNR